jgi:hypothetical protein
VETDPSAKHWRAPIVPMKASGKLFHDDPLYASNWYDSAKELKRKMDLEYEDLRKMQQQIDSPASRIAGRIASS